MLSTATSSVDQQDPLDALEISLRRLRVLLGIGYAIAAIQSRSGSAFDRRAVTAAVIICGLLGGANVLGLLTDRNPSGRRVTATIAVQLGLDTVAAAVASVALLPPDAGLQWLPVLFPVFEAGLRFRLRGLGLLWGLVTIGSLAHEFATRESVDPQAFLTGASLVLVIAAPASYLSQLLFEELRAQASIRIAAERREQLAHVVADAGHRLQSLDLATIRHETAVGVLAAGFDVAELWEFDVAGRASRVGTLSADGADPPAPIDFANLRNADTTVVDTGHASGHCMVHRPLGTGGLAVVGYSGGEQHRWPPAVTALSTLAALCAGATDAARHHLELDTMQRQLRHDATHDALTGLLNRAGLEDHVAAVAVGEAAGPLMGVVFCDLDGFKAVNDQLGHQTGDRVLVEVARRLLASVAQLGGTPARLGGDEFVVLFAGAESEQEIAERVALLQQVLDWPYGIVPGTIAFGASLGWAAVPPARIAGDTDLLDHAMVLADQQMYQSKARRRAQRSA